MMPFFYPRVVGLTLCLRRAMRDPNFILSYDVVKHFITLFGHSENNRGVPIYLFIMLHCKHACHLPGSLGHDSSGTSVLFSLNSLHHLCTFPSTITPSLMYFHKLLMNFSEMNFCVVKYNHGAHFTIGDGRCYFKIELK